MTEITLAREEVPMNNAIKMLIIFISITFMILGLFASINLLQWAVKAKISNVEEVENSKVTASMRERELGCLAMNIYREAGSEPFEGKVAVAQVTLNRVSSGQFPEDVCKTIYQKNVVYEKVICQFSWACDREVMSRPKNPLAYKESMEVAKKVLLEGFRLPSLKNAMYFHGDYINPGWKRKKVAHIGRHIFYE